MHFGKNLRELCLGMSLLLILQGCSPALLNPFTPSTGYSIARDVAYGGNARQELDIYVPDALRDPAPVLVFFYGGSWQSGSKNYYRWVGQSFASRGIVTVIADYRIYPPAHFPQFVNDSAEALAYVHNNIANYGGDPKRLFVAGHSAGAYDAMMLVADPKYLTDAHADETWVRGVIGIAGPYDFLPLTDPALIAIFGGNNRIETQPITFVDGKRPPALLLTGTADETVSPGNTKRLAAKWRANGNEVEEIYYPDVGHIGIILSLAPVFGNKTTLRDDIVNFIAAH